MSAITLRERLNQAPMNQLGPILQLLAPGNVLIGQLPQQLRNQVPVTASASTSPENLTTEDVLVLPDNAKASRITRCTVRAGGATGEFTEKAGYGTTPTTTTVAVTPCGDIAFLHAGDLVTNADVNYLPENGDVIELDLPVVPGTGVCALPSGIAAQGVILLLRAESLAGGVTGRRGILVPAAAATATTKSALNIAKTAVWFAIADAVTRARVRLLLCASKDVQEALAAASPV